MDDLREHIYQSTGGRRNLSMAPKDRTDRGAHAYEPARDLEKLPVRIRPAEPGDVHMIYDSWLNSYASQNKAQPKWALFPMQRTVVRRLMKDNVTLVAAGDNTESEEDIYAWMCANRTKEDGLLTLHYAFTKMLFRRRGLFRALLGAYSHRKGENIYCSHKGFIMKDIKGSYSLRYVPQLQFDWGLGQFERAYAEVNQKGKNIA